MSSMSLKTPMPVDVRLMNVSALVLAVIAALMTLGALLWWAARHPAFAISRIVVQGDTQHHNAITLQANVAGQLKGNFFTLDMASARQSFEAVPWVRRAVVRREFPNGLRVILEEHKAEAFWSLNSESRMVNSQGEVFEANAGEAETEGLPRLVGPEAQSQLMLETYRSLSALFKPYDAQLDTLELSGRGSWRAELDGGTEMELGRGNPQDIVQRTQRFLQSHERVMAAYQRSGLDRVESVDLRHNEGYAIRLRGVTTVSSVNTQAGAATR
jgi:cell division protein FtsQ